MVGAERAGEREECGGGVDDIKRGGRRGAGEEAAARASEVEGREGGVLKEGDERG